MTQNDPLDKHDPVKRKNFLDYAWEILSGEVHQDSMTSEEVEKLYSEPNRSITIDVLFEEIESKNNDD